MKIQFKSRRAAQMAMTKAEKAYVAARQVAACAYQEGMANPNCDDPLAYHDEMKLVADAAWKKGHEVYTAAVEQGWYLKSWHFGSNPTRDLIAMNID